MFHLRTGDDKYREFSYDGGYLSDPTAARSLPSDYRFGRMRATRARSPVRAALSRVNGYVKNMIEAIANSRLLRMERELELRGSHYGRSKSQPAERSRASK
jgi:hypothetical protein